MCVSRVLFALFILVMIATARPSPASAETPCPEGVTTGAVNVLPAVGSVPYANRTEEITVRMAGLSHRGIVGYDDNNNGTPERCVPSNGLGAFEFNLTFNSAVLTVEEAVVGDDIESSGGNRNFQCQERRDDASHFAFACFSTGTGDGPQGSFDMVKITLGLVGGGAANLELEAGLAGPLGDNVPLDVQRSVAITVTGAPVRPTAGPGASPTSEGPLPTTEDDPDGDGTPGTSPSAVATATPDGTPDDKTPSPGDDPDGENSNGEGSNGEGGSGGGDGLSTGGVMLWTLMTLGGIASVGALGFAALRWRGVM